MFIGVICLQSRVIMSVSYSNPKNSVAQHFCTSVFFGEKITIRQLPEKRTHSIFSAWEKRKKKKKHPRK